jgi:hypothetical protein
MPRGWIPQPRPLLNISRDDPAATKEPPASRRARPAALPHLRGSEPGDTRTERMRRFGSECSSSAERVRNLKPVKGTTRETRLPESRLNQPESKPDTTGDVTDIRRVS